MKNIYMDTYIDGYDKYIDDFDKHITDYGKYIDGYDNYKEAGCKTEADRHHGLWILNAVLIISLDKNESKKRAIWKYTGCMILPIGKGPRQL